MANPRFYMSPGTCSTGIHILLEEIGLVFEAYPLNLVAGDQFKPEYLAINPKASVPALVCPDGTTLTTYQSIACWLAKSYPDNRLLPEETDDQAQVMAVMNHAVTTLHGEGFARIFTTERFAMDGKEIEATRAQGRRIIERGFAAVDKELVGQRYVTEHFSIADSALFYVEFWADRSGIPLPENCQRHYRRMLGRPAVRQVLVEEGYSRVFARYATGEH